MINMIELAVASGKGGVGKSTIAASILVELSKYGRNLIAVDADADAPNLHLIINVNRWIKEEKYYGSSLAEINSLKCIRCGACMDICPFDAVYRRNDEYVINQVVCEGCLACKLVCPVEDAIIRRSVDAGVIKVGETKYGFPIISALLNPGRPNTGKLVTREREITKELVKKDTIVLIDSAAGIGCQVVASLVGVDIVILVAEPTPTSFSDLKRIHRLTRHFMQPTCLIINKYDINMPITNEILSYAKQNNMYLLGMIPYDEAIPKSIVLTKPVIEQYPDSKASKELKEIAREVNSILDNLNDWLSKYKPKKPEPYKPIIIKPK